MKNPVSVLGISGSLRAGSAHHAILAWTLHQLSDISFSIFNGIEAIPNFNPDADMPEADSHPAVKAFRKAIEAADAILICTPEYAYGIPGALKNALDWTVSSGSFMDKPVGIITASGLGERAHASLLLVMEALNSHIIEQATLLIPYFKSKLDTANEVTDPDTQVQLKRLVKALAASIAAE